MSIEKQFTEYNITKTFTFFPGPKVFWMGEYDGTLESVDVFYLKHLSNTEMLDESELEAYLIKSREDDHTIGFVQRFDDGTWYACTDNDEYSRDADNLMEAVSRFLLLVI